MLKGFHYPRPKRAIDPEPASPGYSSDFLNIEFWANPSCSGRHSASRARSRSIRGRPRQRTVLRLAILRGE